MQRMFQSATLKLTAWYLAIVMTISITFSVVIYQLNSRELTFRLENLQHSIVDDLFYGTPNSRFAEPGNGPGTPLYTESQKAAGQMAASLIYINVVLFVAGGLGSYFLARRTLRPISEAHEAQSRFTSDASHELRTPLAAMKAELEVSLRDPHLSTEESRELLESNLEEVNKLIRLSEMLLHLSRLDHDKLEVGAVDVVAAMQGVLKQHTKEQQRFDVTTRKKAVARGNEPALSELISILVENALKYSPNASTIKLRVFEQRGMVGFEIANAGEQIPADKIDRLFDRFFRVDSSRTSQASSASSSQNSARAQKGYGLGLSIAKKIIDIHHGSITVVSTPETTTFTFYVPSFRENQAKSQN